LADNQGTFWIEIDCRQPLLWQRDQVVVGPVEIFAVIAPVEIAGSP
jgi:hypothetical protein